MYTPDTIGGMSWLAVADSLKQPDSTQAKAIIGSANLITAAVCKATGDKPAEVCSSATIQAPEKTSSNVPTPDPRPPPPPCGGRGGGSFPRPPTTGGPARPAPGPSQ